MLVLYARWLFLVDDDSKIFDFVREKGKSVAENIDLNKHDPDIDDRVRYPIK